MSDKLQNVRSDGTFDIVHYTYIHGGLSLIREGSSVAPRTGRTVHRTHMHAGPTHAPRRAEHGVFFRVRIARAQLELWPPEGGHPVCAACAPTKKKEAQKMVVEKKTLSAARSDSQVVSKGA